MARDSLVPPRLRHARPRPKPWRHGLARRSDLIAPSRPPPLDGNSALYKNRHPGCSEVTIGS